MREKLLEQKLCKEVKNFGGLALKFVSPGFNGMPDRILLMHGGRLSFVEVKAPGEKARRLQLSRHRLLKRMGFKVFILDGEEQIPKIIKETIGENDGI